MQLHHARLYIVLSFIAIVTIACAAQPTATPTPAPTALPTATTAATPTPDATATVIAQATATAQAEATVNARWEATIAARSQQNATATAVARTTATAYAQATAQAREMYFANLLASAKKMNIQTEGELIGRNWPTMGVFPTTYQLKNLVIEARFFNPADPNINPWDYGFFFRYGLGNPSVSQYRLCVTSSGEWRLMMPTQTVAGGAVQSNHLARGQLSNLDRSPTGSNHLRVIAQETVGHFILNGQYIATLDLPEIHAAEVKLGTAFFTANSFPGLRVKFTDLNLYALP